MSILDSATREYCLLLLKQCLEHYKSVSGMVRAAHKPPRLQRRLRTCACASVLQFQAETSRFSCRFRYKLSLCKTAN